MFKARYCQGASHWRYHVTGWRNNRDDLVVVLSSRLLESNAGLPDAAALYAIQEADIRGKSRFRGGLAKEMTDR